MAEIKHSVKKCISGGKLKHITIETPCRVNELEAILHMVANDGHWHDAKITAEKGKVVVQFKDED